MSSDNKATMTRVIFGVASVGATLALVYLYNRFQERKKNNSSSGSNSSSSSATGSRIRRQSAKSGEVKKVTFKTDEESSSSANNCKSLSQPPTSVLKPQPSPVAVAVASHDATKISRKDDNIPPAVVVGNSSSKSGRDDEPTTNSNSYENNSTLKLNDSSSTTTTIINHSNNVVATPSPVQVVEEVISVRSEGGPLMTSTPLPPSKGSSKRTNAAVFEPHSSDLQSSSVSSPQEVDGACASTATVDSDYDGKEYKREMKIPREIIPGLIGKKGFNIKGIQAQSGTQITFQDETLEDGDRICVIRGSPANVAIGESLIEKYILDQPTIYTETLTVPLSSVGRIIGRGGENIRAIQEKSKARVNVESHNHYGNDTGPPTRAITIKGSQDQIQIAKQLILEQVEGERNLRKTINDTTASRTHRRAGGGTSSSSQNTPISGPGGPGNSSPSVNAEPALPLKQDGILEVFVSCVYHPNEFWIQVVGRDAIELDKLCENMTDHYNGLQKDSSASQFNVGDIVAAPFEVDGKIYRAKIMRIDDDGVEVSYLDYGDRRVLPVTEIFELHPKFLQLRFQAIQATLNLGCIGEKWDDEVINTFCDLTYCAQWQSLTGKIKNYLKDSEDGHDVYCIELLDKEVNLGEELIRRGLATPKGPSGCNGAQGVQKKSYAAVALGVSNNSTVPSGPVISSSDPTIQESLESNGNGN